MGRLGIGNDGGWLRTEHLIRLAGVSQDINRFEFDDIASKALKELSLDTLSHDEVVYGYVYFLIDQALSSKLSFMVVLGALRDLCRDREYDEELFDFYLLAFAKEELEELGVQFYWKNADKNNIDSIINSRFQEWIKKYEVC